jgi:hypothetical protein
LKERIKDEDVIREFVEYKGDYSTLDKDRLVLFSVNYLETNKIEPTFDKIVASAFKLFPRKFSLIGFPEYPDGRTIYYCAYNHCTLDKKWLLGNVQSAFKVTEKGKYFFEETQKMLEGKILTVRAHQSVPKRKESTFISLLKKTVAYRKFVEEERQELDKSEVMEALRASPNSKGMAEANLSKYMEYARRINDSEAIRFLESAKETLEGTK